MSRVVHIMGLVGHPRTRVVLQLGLLAVGLLAVATGAGAPGCLPDGTGTC